MKKNFFDGAQWIAIYGILIFCFLAPLNSAISFALEMDPKRIIFVIGNVLLAAFFAFCLYACRDELIRSLQYGESGLLNQEGAT